MGMALMYTHDIKRKEDQIQHHRFSDIARIVFCVDFTTQ
jgi:hypothetical protein